MNNENLITRVEVAYDIIAKVHFELCNTTSRTDNIPNISLDLLNNISKFIGQLQKRGESQ